MGVRTRCSGTRQRADGLDDAALATDDLAGIVGGDAGSGKYRPGDAPEEGTRAAEMDGQIDEAIKIERAQSLRDISDAIGEAHVSARIGQEMDVLVLGREEDGQLYGRAMCQAPEVDGVVYLEEGEVGDIVRVRITDTLVYEMEGDVVHGS